MSILKCVLQLGAQIHPIFIDKRLRVVITLDIPQMLDKVETKMLQGDRMV